MAPLKQRVDPPPIRPPAIGLLTSANNVVVGSDFEITEDAYEGDFSFRHLLNGASGPGEPPAPSIPRYDDSQANVDAAAYAAGFVEDDGRPVADWEKPTIGQPVHWIRGYSYRPELCNGGQIIDPEGTTGGVAPTLNGENQIDTVPFIVEGADRRSTFGTPGEGEYDEARQWARRQLLACESKQIAQELWKGTQSKASNWGNRYLCAPDVNMVEGTHILGYVSALGALERAVHDLTCGQQGMIHARADLVSLWDTGGALRRVGNLILTIQDTIVVTDAGYDGSAPDAGTPGFDPVFANKIPGADSSWAYATTVVDVRRSAFITSQPIRERLDQTGNTLTTYERRVASAVWGCLHVGVYVDHTNSLSSTGS